MSSFPTLTGKENLEALQSKVDEMHPQIAVILEAYMGWIPSAGAQILDGTHGAMAFERVWDATPGTYTECEVEMALRIKKTYLYGSWEAWEIHADETAARNEALAKMYASPRQGHVGVAGRDMCREFDVS